MHKQPASRIENADGLKFRMLRDQRFHHGPALGDVLERQSEIHGLPQPARRVERDDRNPRIVQPAQDVGEFLLVEQNHQRHRHRKGAQESAVQDNQQPHAASTPWRRML